MEFYLTYEGPLNATQRDPRDGERSRHVANKREMRRHFHSQLKTLWNVLPALHDDEMFSKPVRQFLVTRSPSEVPTTRKQLAEAHAHFGFNFVPLVTADLDLLCSLEILMLRPDRPGRTAWSGDIDNRLKTLLDALRITEANEHYSELDPEDSEKPFFVLLEDDKLLTKVSVETDRLLSCVNSRMDDVRLFIRVRIKPYDVHPDNMHFG
jgi:hypothetical protein